MRVGFLEFLQQVRAEAGKVAWPSRRETVFTSVMIAFMVVLASIFFLVVDWSLSALIGFFLGS